MARLEVCDDVVLMVMALARVIEDEGVEPEVVGRVAP
jgi:hypothetical protein